MSQREAITIRFPPELICEAKAVKEGDESFNELVVSSLEQEVRHRRGMAALAAIGEVRERILARTGPQPDPNPLIRSLREGDGRHD